MIICKNCGAEYDEVLDRCPYCGQENEVKSEQKYATKLRHLETEPTIPATYSSPDNAHFA